MLTPFMKLPLSIQYSSEASQIFKRAGVDNLCSA